MKKILFAALIVISITSSAFTKEEKKTSSKEEKKICYRTLNAFAVEFNEATDVCWTSKCDFDKASFNLNGKQLSAFYTYSGEKIGTTQGVDFESLPSKAKKSIAAQYKNYSVKEAILLESDRESAYYVLIENNSQSLILKVMDEYVAVFKKTKPVINSNSFEKPLQLALF